MFCQKKRFFFKKKSVNINYLKTYQHIDDFGVSDTTDKIFVLGLDFGPA